MSNFLRFLGLARKSGNAIPGGNLTEVAIKRGSVSLVILAEDASDGTKKKFQAMAANQGVEIRTVSCRDDLGQAIGKGQITVIGISDENMSEKLKELCIVM